MRLAVTIAIASSACAPTSKQVATAQSATYDADARALFELAKEAARERYGVAAVDESNLALLTEPLTYEPDGRFGARGWGRHPVRVAFVVHVVPVGSHRARVSVTVRAKRASEASRTGCDSWVDIDPSDAVITPAVESWRERLLVAIYVRARDEVAAQ